MWATSAKGIRCGRAESAGNTAPAGTLGPFVEDLVLAMPCREFISLRGRSPRIALTVLDSLQDDTWFAIPAAIREDPLAVEVRLAIYRIRGDDVFVDRAGRAVAACPVFAEHLGPGPRLAALRRYAEAKAGSRSELVGYLYEPVAFPRMIHLLYQAPAQTEVQAGGSGAWLARHHLASVLQQPLDRLALEVGS